MNNPNAQEATMKISVTLWKNLTHPFESYAKGPQIAGFCNVWEGEVDQAGRFQSDIAEVVFSLHNRDDRPTGQLCPSASVGDLVQVGDAFFAVESFGFAQVPCPDGGPAHLPRCTVGAAYFARTRAEYVEAEAAARDLVATIEARTAMVK